MVTLRTFRNSDPPRLVELWNAVFTGRGAVALENSTPLEQFVFAKPTFDPAGLIFAEEDNKLVGFAHAALSCAPADAGPVGVTCVLGVVPAYRRHDVAARLLEECERYLKERGAKTLQAGACYPHNPFYLGLYGGSDSPGFLQSDPLAAPFFQARGYQVSRNIIVFQKDLENTLRIADPRFTQLRNRFDVVGCMPRRLAGFWQECILGFIEPIELRVEDKTTGEVFGRTLVWEMEGFSRRWGGSAIGILRFEIDASVRRQGVGKFLLATLLRQVREQFFRTAEIQLDATNDNAIRFLQKLAFHQVDTGQVYTKAV